MPKVSTLRTSIVFARRLLGGTLAACLATSAWGFSFVTEENPPLNFTRDGQVAGVSTAVVREMATRANLTSDFTVMAWPQAYARAQESPEACVYSTVRSPERASLFQWIGPITRGEWSLFGRQGFSGEVKKVDDLKPYRIGVQNDARAGYLRSRGFGNLVVAENPLDLAAMITPDPKQLGRIDLWMAQSLGAADIARNAGVTDLKVVFPGIMSQDYWLACNLRTAPETLKALSEALSAMRKDGTLRKLATPPR